MNMHGYEFKAELNKLIDIESLEEKYGGMLPNK